MLAMRRKTDVLTTLFFFIIVVSLFPLGNVFKCGDDLSWGLTWINRVENLSEKGCFATGGRCILAFEIRALPLQGNF